MQAVEGVARENREAVSALVQLEGVPMSEGEDEDDRNFIELQAAGAAARRNDPLLLFNAVHNSFYSRSDSASPSEKA